MIRKVLSNPMSRFQINSISRFIIYPHNKTCIQLKIKYKFSQNDKQPESIDQLLTRFINNKLTISVSEYSKILASILKNTETLDLTDHKVTVLLQYIEASYKYMKDKQIIDTIHYIVDVNVQSIRMSLFKKLWIQIMDRFESLQMLQLIRLYQIMTRVKEFENSTYMKNKYKQIYKKLTNVLSQIQTITLYSKEEMGKQNYYDQCGFCVKQKCCYMNTNIFVILIKTLKDSGYKNSPLQNIILEKTLNQNNYSENLSKLSVKQLKKIFVTFQSSDMDYQNAKFVHVAQKIAQIDYFTDDISFGLVFQNILSFIKLLQRNNFRKSFKFNKVITKQMKDYGIRILQYLFKKKQIIRNDCHIISMVMVKLTRVQIYQKHIFDQIFIYYSQIQPKLQDDSICLFFKVLAFLQTKTPHKNEALLNSFINIIKNRYDSMPSLQKSKISEIFQKFYITPPKQITFMKIQGVNKNVFKDKNTFQKKQNNDQFLD